VLKLKRTAIIFAMLAVSALTVRANLFTTLSYTSPYWFGPTSTQALAINDNGQVFGTTCCFAADGAIPQGWFYYDGTSQFTTCYSAGGCVTGPYDNLRPSLPCPGDGCFSPPFGTPVGFNDSQTMVGTYYDSNTYDHEGFVEPGALNPSPFSPSSTLDYPGLTPFYYDSYITGINDAGTIVGYYNDYLNNVGSGYIYQNGVFSQLSFTPLAINNNGQILGQEGNGDIVIDTKGTVRNLGIIPFTPDGFNDSFQIVGGDDFYANGQVTQIMAPGGIPVQINGINDSGEMVGSYNSGQNTYGFLASTPEPGYVALLGLMLLLLFGFRQRPLATGKRLRQ
jgi:hypothetical protein